MKNFAGLSDFVTAISFGQYHLSHASYLIKTCCLTEMVLQRVFLNVHSSVNTSMARMHMDQFKWVVVIFLLDPYEVQHC